MITIWRKYRKQAKNQCTQAITKERQIFLSDSWKSDNYMGNNIEYPILIVQEKILRILIAPITFSLTIICLQILTGDGQISSSTSFLYLKLLWFNDLYTDNESKIFYVH